MANSAFQPTVLTLPSTGGTGQGELNLITNPVAATDTTGWVGAGRGTSGGPLNPSVSTYFTVLNAASAESSTSGAYDVITLPSGLQNRKLKVEFYYTSPAADTFKVSMYKGSTRVPLSTDVSGSTSLPQSTTGKFTAYFDTDSSGTWTLSITRTAGTGSTALQFTQVVVGPGIQPQGAVVGGWQTYTPTVSGVTTSSVTGLYRRVGDSIEIDASFTLSAAATAQVKVSMPTGLSINSTAITGFGVNNGLGKGVFRVTSGDNRAVSVVPNSDNTLSFTGILSTSFGVDFFTTGSGASGQSIQFNVTVPIAEWAGSGTVQLAQNDVEYASNSANSSSDDTTSFTSDLTASRPPNATPVASSGLVRRVRFSSPIQRGDVLTTIISFDSGVTWRAVGTPNTSAMGTAVSTFGLDGSSSAYVGISEPYVISANQAEVRFGKYCQGATSETWIQGAFSSFRWAVRKSSAGAAVGFGIVQPGVSSGLVSASGLPGNTTGSAIATGYVGEKIDFTSRVVSATTAGFTASASALCTLQPGIYIVFGETVINGVASLTSVTSFISTNGLNDGTGSIGTQVGTNTAGASTFNPTQTLFPEYISVTSSTSLYAKSRSYGISTTVTFYGYVLRIA